MVKKCEICDTEFTAKGSTKTCSDECSHVNFKVISSKNKRKLYKITSNKIKFLLRSRLYSAIKNGQKTGSAVKDLGCTVDYFVLYIESIFKDWMNWDNWGKYSKCKKTWHLDHIKPLDSFDLTNREELLKACHYTNLQPILAKDNLIKSNKL